MVLINKDVFGKEDPVAVGVLQKGVIKNTIVKTAPSIWGRAQRKVNVFHGEARPIYNRCLN